MYNSGDADDQLNIWIHEYNNENPKGVPRLIQTFRGNLLSNYLVAHDFNIQSAQANNVVHRKNEVTQG